MNPARQLIALSLLLSMGCKTAPATPAEPLVPSTQAQPSSQAQETLDVLFTLHVYEPAQDEECAVEDPSRLLMRAVACWSSTRGWVSDPGSCVSGERELFSSTQARATLTGERASSCLYVGDAVEGFEVKGELTAREDMSVWATRASAFPPPSMPRPADDQELPLPDLLFTPQLVEQVKAFYPADRHASLDACFAPLLGRTLKEAELDRVNFQYNGWEKLQLKAGAPEQSLMMLGLGFIEGCTTNLALMSQAQQTWQVIALNDQQQVLDEGLGWSLFFLPWQVSDLNQDGAVEMWLPLGGETERAYYFVTLKEGRLVEVGAPQFFGD